LLAAMTGVGGLLFALSGGTPGPTADGLSLPPLLATRGPRTLESIFQTPAALTAGRWSAIVIHDSGTGAGSTASLEQQAKAMNLKGLGYHFVVGNGKGMDDGELHVGRRWLDQLPGAHAAGSKADWFNQNAIGICLVGDGDRRGFTAEQMTRLTELVAALQSELGIPANRVYLHRDIAPTPSPGRYFPAAAFQQSLPGQ